MKTKWSQRSSSLSPAPRFGRKWGWGLPRALAARFFVGVPRRVGVARSEGAVKRSGRGFDGDTRAPAASKSGTLSGRGQMAGLRGFRKPVGARRAPRRIGDHAGDFFFAAFGFLSGTAAGAWSCCFQSGTGLTGVGSE